MIIVMKGLNPEPWTSPTASVGRKGGRVIPQLHKNARLRNYQAAIKEMLEKQGMTPVYQNKEPVELHCFFWRQIERYETATGRKQSRHKADATNLLKALEDALQGFAFKNDSQVQLARSCIVEQKPETEPKIVVVVTYASPDPEAPLVPHQEGDCYVVG